MFRPPKDAAMSFSPPRLSKQDINNSNYYQETMENIHKKSIEPSITNAPSNPSISQGLGQGWFPSQECSFPTTQDPFFKLHSQSKEKPLIQNPKPNINLQNFQKVQEMFNKRFSQDSQNTPQ